MILRFVIGQPPSLTGRGSPAFTTFGYALIMFSGLMMVLQSLRLFKHSHHEKRALIAGVGLIPCPLTVAVLGFAWVQTSSLMVIVVLVALALGIGMTMGAVALLATIAQRAAGAAALTILPRLEGWGRWLQGVCGVAIIAISIYAILSLR